MMSFLFWVDLVMVSYLGAVVILLVRNAEFNDLVDNLLGGFQTKLKVWIFVSYTLIAFPLGMYGAKLLWGFNTREIDRYRERPVVSLLSEGDSYIRYPLYFISLLSILAVIYTYVVIGFIPLLKASQLDSETAVMQLRTKVDIGFGGNVYFKNIFGTLLTPILTYVAFAYYRKTKTKRDLVWFLVMFASVFFMLTYDLSKSPFIRFLFGFLFFIILTRKVSFGKVLRFALLAIVLFIVTFTVFGKSDSVTSLLFSYNTGITGRLIISQISSLYQHVELFPKYHPYIGFSSLSKVLSPGHPSERSARIVMEIASPSWIEMDIGGVYNTLFIGEAYANFGLWGVILSPLWIGALIQSFFIGLIRARKTPLLLGVFTYFSYNSNLTGGFNEYLYDARILSLAVILGGCYVVAVYLKRSKELHGYQGQLHGSGVDGVI